MKITKEKLRQIIKEEVEKRIVVKEATEKADVARLGKKLDRTSGLEQLLSTITDRIEFEQFIRNVIRQSSKNIKHNEIIRAITNIKRALDKEQK